MEVTTGKARAKDRLGQRGDKEADASMLVRCRGGGTMSEVKEFWEWCGAEYLEKLGGFRFPDSSFYRLSQLTDFTDPIVLGLLFKWAVPKLVSVAGRFKAYLLLSGCLSDAILLDTKFEDKVYEAIQKVREEQCQK